MIFSLLSVFVLSFLCGALASWFLLLYLIPKLGPKFLDKPNFRSSHIIPTPRFGGISFVLLGTVSSAMYLLFGSASSFTILPLLSLPLALVGFIDDKYALPVPLRYVFQFFTAFLLIVFSPASSDLLVSLSVPFFPKTLFVLLLLVCITAIINFVNFMDGLDGLVGGCMFVILAALSLLLSAPWTMWFLVGSILGFLFWNWSPAKVFMGDSGSTFLGALFASLILHTSSFSISFLYLLIATPLLADACSCVLRRYFARQPVFQPHRLHLYQRLQQSGLSHAQVSSIYIAATAALAMAMISCGGYLVFCLAVLELCIGFWLDQNVAVPFAVASKS